MRILRLSLFYLLFFLVFLKKSCSACKSLVAGLGVHPVDSEVSTLIIALPRLSWSVRARLQYKGFHLSLLVAHPMLAFRSILTPGPERWTPPPCPGFGNPIEVKFPFQAVLFAIRVSPGEGGGPIHLFQKVRRFISKNRNVRAVSPHVPNYLVPDWIAFLVWHLFVRCPLVILSYHI